VSGAPPRAGARGSYEAAFAVLRTPALPVDDLLRLGEGLEAPAAAPAGLEAALQRDRRRVAGRVRALAERPDVREALSVASPSLVDGLARSDEDRASDRARKVERSALRYLARMAARPTPFGLCAGCSLAAVGDGEGTKLELAPAGAYRRRTRLDGGYLGALAAALRDDPAIRRRLSYFPSSSIYRSGGRLRYAEPRTAGDRVSYHLVAADASPHLDAVLARAGRGARPHELAAAVRALDPAVDPGEADAFVDELVEHGLLVPELAPAVTAADPLDGLTGPLREIADEPRAHRAMRALDAARAALAALDREPARSAPARRREAVDALRALPASLDESRLFHVELFKPARARLARRVVDEVARGVELLHRVGGTAHRDRFGAFREAFAARYGDREVPLAEVLDEESGIGFAGSGAPAGPAEPLLEGLAFPGGGAAEAPTRPERDALLLEWVGEALRTGAGEIALGPGELDRLEAAGRPPPPLPDAFGAVATLLAGSEADVAGGRYRVQIASVGGPSGANLLGRFCGGDDQLRRRVRGHLAAEEALRPDAVFAEVAHMPQQRIGNVLSRPPLRRYEIPYLGRSGVPRERQLPIGDLLVAVEGGRVVLRSRRLGREVLPRLTAAHDFTGPGNLAVYRFLCALQVQGVAEGLQFSFGALERAPHLPRVVAGRVVLSPARWSLREEELRSLRAPGGARFAALQELRRRRGLPRWVAVADADKLLPIDLDSALSADVAAGLLADRAHATLVELHYGPGDLLARGPEGRFVHELVLPFVRTPVRTPAPRPPASARPPAIAPVERRFAPGSDWLYAKLYAGTAGADVALRSAVRPVVADALASGAASRWFFIRYGDPDWHLRVRLHGPGLDEVGRALHEAVEPLVADGIVWRVQLDTYEREVEHYGGPDGVVLSERLFHADSEAALGVVEALAGDDRADLRWRAALLGIDRLLDDLGLYAGEKGAVVGAARRRFGDELRVDASLRRQLGERYRVERPSLESLLARRPDGGGPLAAVLALHEARSAAVLAVAAELREAERAGRLAVPLVRLAGSYVHLHANRVLRSAPWAQELVIYDFLSRLYASAAARGRSTTPSTPAR
jgi:lantibiotic biosynthesis protein